MPTANFSLWFWVAFGVAANAFCPDRSPLTPPRAPFAVLSKWRQSTTASVDSTSKPCRYRKSLRMSSTSALPRIQPSHLEELAEKGYTVIQNFLPDDLQSSLRQDVSRLRQKGMFKVAKIGQDSTNTLNEDIRVAETCFIGANKLQDVSSDSRSRLYTLLGQVRDDLSGNAILNTDNAVTKGTPPLDGNLDELLYVYYPQGGFYRRHLDSVGQSASVLRCYSLLLYLNEDWKPINGGQLRLYPDRGGYEDVPPTGGTLVLFKSDMIPHEVLDTNAERVAVVGWYNRGVAPADIASLAPAGDKTRVALLAASVALISAGIAMIIMQ